MLYRLRAVVMLLAREPQAAAAHYHWLPDRLGRRTLSQPGTRLPCAVAGPASLMPRCSRPHGCPSSMAAAPAQRFPRRSEKNRLLTPVETARDAALVPLSPYHPPH